MRAATWTMGGPENLITSHLDWFVVQPRWKAEPARIPHPGLRTHLEDLCDDGACMSYVGAEYCPWPQHWLTGQATRSSPPEAPTWGWCRPPSSRSPKTVIPRLPRRAWLSSVPPVGLGRHVSQAAGG
jgi:hypothetical protein